MRFKQAPVVGLLQASLSYIVGGQHPDLTAGWLLNAILHPLNLVLFYLVGKHVVGRAAVWFAIIAALNHWVIHMKPCACITDSGGRAGDHLVCPADPGYAGTGEDKSEIGVATPVGNDACGPDFGRTNLYSWKKVPASYVNIFRLLRPADLERQKTLGG